MKTVIKKGYTLEVVSWENDGDYYNTKYLTVQDKELAIELARMCTTLFHSGKGGVSNEDREAIDEDVVINYVKDRPVITKYLKEEYDYDEDFMLDTISELANNLIDCSEYYAFRVCESVNITYSPEDIKVESVEF